jgi:hypothetical protein
MRDVQTVQCIFGETCCILGYQQVVNLILHSLDSKHNIVAWYYANMLSDPVCGTIDQVSDMVQGGTPCVKIQGFPNEAFGWLSLSDIDTLQLDIAMLPQK